ncbi:hypothetical protein JCM6882_005830 [Rhodosporidiobolus microsporus]
MGDPAPHPRPPPATATHPVLLLPALPQTQHAAPWLAQWERTGETQMEGMKLWAIEQRVTDRHALLPVIVVLTGDKSDVISVERFELRDSKLLKKEVSDRLWEETRAVLKQSGARINETQQGFIPITALPSLPPSLSLVQIPGGDYRDVVLQLYQNINLRRLGLGGRSGLRLANATPAQQLHFRQSYRLPMPPPSSSSAPAASTSTPPFTHTLLSLITLVQHALSLFGLGPVKAFLSPSVLSQLPATALPPSAAASTASPTKLLEILDRLLLDSLVRTSAALPPGNSDHEAAAEDYADALGLPLSLFDVGSTPGFAPTSIASTSTSAHGQGAGPGGDDPLTRAGGAHAPLLEGDGLLCDVTVSALALFRIEYAARLLSPSASSSSSSVQPTPTSAAVGNLLRDEAVLSPGLLAALLSLAVGARGKMLALGGVGGEAEGQGVPKDVFERRGRFLACVGGFMKSHPSSPSSLPPVLTPAFLTYLHATYTQKFHPAPSAPSSPTALGSGTLSALRGGLSSLASALPHRSNGGGGTSTPGGSDAEASDAAGHSTAGSSRRKRRRSLHRPHIPHPHLPLAFTRRSAGRNGEECETADLEAFVSETLAGGLGSSGGASAGGLAAGEGEKGKGRAGKGRGVGGRSARGVWGYGSGAVWGPGGVEQGREEREKGEQKEGRRERRRRRRTEEQEQEQERQRREERTAETAGEDGVVEKPDGALVPSAPPLPPPPPQALAASKPPGLSPSPSPSPSQSRTSTPSHNSLSNSSLSRTPTSTSHVGTATTATATSAGASLGSAMGRGVGGAVLKGVRGVREKAGRAKRRMEDGLGLTDSQSVLGEDKTLASADTGAVDERAKLVAPQVVVSPDSGNRSAAPPAASAEEDSKEVGQSAAVRTATFASRLASALLPPQVSVLPTSSSSSGIASGGASRRSSRHASPGASPGGSPRPDLVTGTGMGREKLRLDTNFGLHSGGGGGSRATSVRTASGSAASSRGQSPIGSSPTTVRSKATARFLSPPTAAADAIAARRPSGPRRTVSEMPVEAIEERMEGREADREVGKSLLFGGGGGGVEEEAVSEEEEESEAGSRDEEEEEEESAEDDDEEADRVVFRPPPPRRPSPAPAQPSSSSSPLFPPRASLPLKRRHTLTVPPSHASAPEPWAWLSRRRLEVEVNLRWAAWELRGREGRLEEARKGLEAIHRSYTRAIASLQPHLDSKTATLTSLTARSSTLTARLDSLTSSASSPLTKLSTGTSRLHYAQAVLDDKLRDVLEFEAMLEAKVGAEGTLQIETRKLGRERAGMRRLVGVLELWGDWVGGWGRWAGCDIPAASERQS